MKSTGLEVTRANVLTGPDGRSKGCGIVEFATAEEAKEAVEKLTDTELKGRQIFVREDREDRPGGGFSAAPAAPSGHKFSADEQAQSRRVYVGNLSWDVAWQDLKDHMKQVGEVTHAEVMTDQYTGRSKGCGVVEFATDEGAQSAIEQLTNTELKGRLIFVREDRETTGKSGGSVGGGGSSRGHSNPAVYVWNISSETSWQDLKDHMRKAGNVDSASVFTNSSGDTNGVVVYQRAQDAARALRELQGSELHGSTLNLREDRMHFGRGGPGRGGGRGRGGRGHGRGGDRGGDRDRGGDSGSQVYVGNLAPEITWKELKDHFRQCGDVKRAEVKTLAAGQSRGYGLVLFSKKEEADDAISRLNGSELQGRTLEVRPDTKNR